MSVRVSTVADALQKVCPESITITPSDHIKEWSIPEPIAHAIWDALQKLCSHDGHAAVTVIHMNLCDTETLVIDVSHLQQKQPGTKSGSILDAIRKNFQGLKDLMDCRISDGTIAGGDLRYRITCSYKPN